MAKKKRINEIEALEKAAAERAHAHYVLKLYVAGMTPKSSAAIRSVTDICEEHLKRRYTLEVIDIYQPAADGRAVPVYLWANRLDRPDGATICMVGVDLTKMEASRELIQHLQEQRAALAESEERYRLATKATSEAIWDLNLMAGTVHWNGTYATMFGRPPETGNSWQWWIDRIHPEDRERTSGGLREAIDNGKSGWTCEYRFLRADGAWAHIFDRAHIARDKSGKAFRVVGAMLDLTERKRAEAALQESEARFRSVLDTSRDVIYRLNVQTGRYEYISPSALKLVGYSAAELMAMDSEASLAMVHPDDLPATRATLARLEKTGEEEVGYRQRVKNGGYRWISNRMSLAGDSAGRPLYRNGNIRDITDRKRAEEALKRMNATLEHRVAERTAEVQQQASQLRALASDLSQTEQRERKRLARILHDHVQQLLVAGRMQVEWLKRDSNPERVQATTEGVDAILREALEATRSLAVELSPPVLHETGLIGALNWLASRTLERNQFTVHLLSDNKAEPPTEDTRFLLFECARELLLNAMKHSGVSEAQVTLTRTRDDCVKLIVRDEGKGFDPDTFKKRRADGVSFGLFSIQQRLAHIGGEMEIATMPGKGTSVTLTVPVGEAQPPAGRMDEAARKEESAGQVSVRGKTAMCRVLIVDDHKIMREGLVGLMQFEPDIEVVGQAADGPEAIELAKKLGPDVIIMDVNLGKTMNGVEATRRILAGNPNIRVIGLSMHTDQDVAGAMRDAGATAYLTKGGPSEDLIETIRACRAR